MLVHPCRLVVSRIRGRSRVRTFSEATASENAIDSVSKKKKSNKTAEGGADKDIRPVNKQLRGSRRASYSCRSPFRDTTENVFCGNLDMIADAKFQEAKQLFSKMKLEGPKPNVPTYNIMTNLFKAENDFAALQQLNDEMAAAFGKKKRSAAIGSDDLPDLPVETSKAKPVRKYRPAYRTGPNALLRALSAAPEGLSKDDLVAAAQPLCDVSFSVPSDYNGFYTAWNSMSQLVSKGFVEKRGGVRSRDSEIGLTYHITEAGTELAKQLAAEAADIEQGKAAVPTQAKRAAAAIAQGAGATGKATLEAAKLAAEADS